MFEGLPDGADGGVASTLEIMERLAQAPNLGREACVDYLTLDRCLAARHREFRWFEQEGHVQVIMMRFSPFLPFLFID